MNNFKKQLAEKAVSYSLNTYYPSTITNNNSSLSSLTTSVFVDKSILINDLKSSLVFKSTGIDDMLVKNNDILICLTETLKLISEQGLFFNAELELIEDDIEKNKFLLIYRPFETSNNTNISVPEFLANSNIKILYKKIIKNLFKYSIEVRKSVIIDEQAI